MSALVNDHALMREVLEWANQRLDAVNAARVPAFPDFNSGVPLVRLVESLLAIPIPNVKQTPATFNDKKANVAAALTVAEKTGGLRFMGLVHSDIATGRENAVCELVATLLLNFDASCPLAARLARKYTTVKAQKVGAPQQHYVRAKAGTIVQRQTTAVRKPSVADIFTPQSLIAFAEPSPSPPGPVPAPAHPAPEIVLEREQTFSQIRAMFGQQQPQAQPTPSKAAPPSRAATAETRKPVPATQATAAAGDPAKVEGSPLVSPRKFWERQDQQQQKEVLTPRRLSQTYAKPAEAAKPKEEAPKVASKQEPAQAEPKAAAVAPVTPAKPAEKQPKPKAEETPKPVEVPKPKTRPVVVEQPVTKTEERTHKPAEKHAKAADAKPEERPHRPAKPADEAHKPQEKPEVAEEPKPAEKPLACDIGLQEEKSPRRADSPKVRPEVLNANVVQEHPTQQLSAVEELAKQLAGKEELPAKPSTPVEMPRPRSPKPPYLELAKPKSPKPAEVDVPKAPSPLPVPAETKVEVPKSPSPIPVATEEPAVKPEVSEVKVVPAPAADETPAAPQKPESPKPETTAEKDKPEKKKKREKPSKDKDNKENNAAKEKDSGDKGDKKKKEKKSRKDKSDSHKVDAPAQEASAAPSVLLTPPESKQMEPQVEAEQHQAGADKLPIVPAGVDEAAVTGHRRRPSREFHKTEIKRHLSPDHLANAVVSREVSAHLTAPRRPSPMDDTPMPPDAADEGASPLPPSVGQQQVMMTPPEEEHEAEKEKEKEKEQSTEESKPEEDPWNAMLSSEQTAQAHPEPEQAMPAADDIWGSMASASSSRAALDDTDEPEDGAVVRQPDHPEPVRRNRVRTELNARGLTALPADVAGDLRYVMDLDMSSNLLPEVPRELAAAASLETLSLACNRISRVLPGSLPPSLRVLRLSSNDLSTLPAHVLELPQLEELYVCACELKKVEAPAPNKAAPLRRLSLERNELRVVPDGLDAFASTLIELVLVENELAELPASFAKLTNLEDLNVSTNNLKKLPEGLAMLPSLKKLNFSQNLISDAPADWAEPGAFAVLQELQARANRLHQLPHDMLGACGETVELLDLSDNELKELPALDRCIALAALFAGGNRLTESPQGLSLDCLLCLDLSRNCLTRLPDLRSAPQLRMLHLGHNPVSRDAGLMPPPPSTVSELHLSGCGLHALPDCLATPLDQLEILCLAGNELEDIPGMWRCSMGLRSCDISRNRLRSVPRFCARGIDLQVDGGPERAEDLVVGAATLVTGARVGWADTLGRRDTMEDAISVVGNIVADGRTDLFALYDGHGGRDVAEMFAREFPAQIRAAAKRHKSEGGVMSPKALASAMRRANREIKAEALRLEEMQGATALICMVRKATEGSPRALCVANSGDSRAVLCRKGTALRVSCDHKPLDRSEFDRITKAGGYVTEKGQIQGMLSVARAVGDFELRPFVTEEPHVEMHELKEGEDEFIIMACDGVWDVLSDDCAVRIAREALGKDRSDPAGAAAMVRDWAFLSGSGDNISVAVVVL